LFLVILQISPKPLPQPNPHSHLLQIRVASLWQTVNKLLRRKSTSPLPTSISLSERFVSFSTDKIIAAHPFQIVSDDVQSDALRLEQTPVAYLFELC